MLLPPDRAAIVDVRRDDRADGQALREAIDRRAEALVAAGIGPGETVAIRARGTVGFFVDLFAAWRCGACAACLSASLTDDEAARLIDFTGACAVIGDAGIEPVASAQTSAGQAAALSIDHPALILFTSGTTGDPKGVVHSFRSLLARLALNRAELGAMLDRALNVLPVHFGHGLIGNCLSVLMAGGTLHLLESPSMPELATLGDVIDRHSIAFMSSVPSFWTLAQRLSPRPAPGTLRRVHVGSAPLALDRWQAIADWAGTRAVYNTYGITETANWIGGGALSDDGAGDGYVGRIWGGAWAVVTDDGRRATHSAEGEVVVVTPSLMSGYLKRPDLTAAALKDGWFATGDVGRLDADGRLTITGRRKDEINRAGIKVQPAEVDLLLARHPAVADVCCFAEPDPASGERVAVAIVLADGAEADAQTLRRWAGERIRRECVPEGWHFIDAIPRTDRGKLNRDLVRAHCQRLGEDGTGAA